MKPLPSCPSWNVARPADHARVRPDRRRWRQRQHDLRSGARRLDVGDHRGEQVRGDLFVPWLRPVQDVRRRRRRRPDVRDAADLDVRATYEGVDWRASGTGSSAGSTPPTSARCATGSAAASTSSGPAPGSSRRRCSRSTASRSRPDTSWSPWIAAVRPRHPRTRHGAVPHVGHDHADRRSPGVADHRRRRVRRRGAGSRLRELRHRRHDPATGRAHADGRGRRRVDAVHRAVPAPDARADRRHRRARRAVGCRRAGHVA